MNFLRTQTMKEYIILGCLFIEKLKDEKIILKLLAKIQLITTLSLLRHFCSRFATSLLTNEKVGSYSH